MYRWIWVFVLVTCAAIPAAAQAPTVGDNGVVNSASFTPFGQPGHGTAPGSIVSIFGTNFASALTQSSSIPLSTSLGGVSVSFNGTPAPLYFVIGTQINAQLPAGLTGNTATIVVTTGAGASAPKTIQIAPTSPAIFTTNQQGTGQGIVVFALEPTVFAAQPSAAIPACPPAQAGQPCARPAKVGDFLTIYANGLGAVNPPVADGNAAPGAPPLAETVNRPTVTVGGQAADVLFSGLVPSLVGLYQINIQVPTGVAAGNASLQITTAGVSSSSLVTIAIQ